MTEAEATKFGPGMFNGLSSPLSTGPQPGPPPVGASSGGRSAVINVYATPGMDVAGVANVVDGKLRTIFQELRR